eukprot:scaffold2526_cov52-Phaeocystis_antarctica.AAC.1
MSRESKRTVRARRSRARTVRLERGHNGKLYYLTTGRGHHHQSGGATPGPADHTSRELVIARTDYNSRR